GAYPAFLAPLTSRMDAAIYRAELTALIDRFKPHRISGFDGSFEGHPEADWSGRADFGFVQFSSGTTSLRKGVFISEPNLIAQVKALAETLGMTPDDRVASWLPLYHDMGLITSFFAPLVVGCPVTMLDPVEWSYQPLSILETIHEDRSTLCWMPDF